VPDRSPTRPEPAYANKQSEAWPDSRRTLVGGRRRELVPLFHTARKRFDLALVRTQPTVVRACGGEGVALVRHGQRMSRADTDRSLRWRRIVNTSLLGHRMHGEKVETRPRGPAPIWPSHGWMGRWRSVMEADPCRRAREA
jgi:hypothetical protein